MFCLRSWLPLLFIPTNASPTFIFLFFVCTYFLNRPCVYCSFLLLILFLTSCNWSDRCFFDFSSNWFEPRSTSFLPAASFTGVGSSGSSSSSSPNYCSHCHSGHASNNGTADAWLSDGLSATAALALDMVNTTASALAAATAQQLSQHTRTEWTGIGIEWLRSLLGRREWRIECLDVYIRL